MSELITRVLKDLRARQKELQPLAEEYREVESTINALEQTVGPADPTPRRGARRKSSPNGARRGRPRKGEPTRSDQFLAWAREQPGITIGEAAERMSVQPNYLYRVSAKLEGEGSIARDGERGFITRDPARV